MTAPSITLLLEAARHGDLGATNRLYSAAYRELKTIARANRRRWRGNPTMNTTALIHETFLRLAGSGASDFANRVHFFATASKAMRQILVNYAERQSASKRGGQALLVTLEESVLAAETSADELLTLHELLGRMEAAHPRRCRVIECRIFGGMTIDEVAEALEISTATVKREWQLGTASLYREMRPGAREPTGATIAPKPPTPAE